MKNLPLGQKALLFVCTLFFIAFLGCRKDTFLPSEEAPLALPVAHLPISVDEARDFFSNLHQSSNSLDGNEEHRLVKLDPLWAQAFVGHSPSGREIVVVPLADTSLRTLNHGRADAKLLFSKVGQDSIEAQVLVWAADRAYYTAQDSTVNFSTFTGAYLFFDVGLHFQYGIGVLDGSPVALVDSIGRSGGQAAPDREESPCVPAVDFFVFCLDGEENPEPDEPGFTNSAQQACMETYWIWYECTLGGGGNNGGNNGGGGGGGGGGGNGTGNPPSPPANSFWQIFNDNVPMQALQAFVQNGGTLPNGITLSQAQQLIYLNTIYDLNQSNLQWLTNNTLILTTIYNYVIAHPAPIGEDLMAVARLIALSQQCGLNFYQQYYLAGHLDEVDEFYNFASGNNYSPAAQTAVKALIDARLMNSSAPLPSTVLTKLLEFISNHCGNESDTNVAKSVSLAYIEIVASNDLVLQEMMSDIEASGIDDLMWDFLVEQLQEAMGELLADLIPGGTLVTLGPQAIQQFKDGDWLGGMWTIVTIAVNEADIFFPAAKVWSFASGIIGTSVKLSKFYEVMKKVKNLGDDVALKVYQVLRNRLDKLYSKIQWGGNTVGAQITGTSPLDIWDDLISAFGANIPTSQPNPDEILATFVLGGSSYEMKFYLNSSTTGGPTIAIKKGNNGPTFKMRF